MSELIAVVLHLLYSSALEKYMSWLYLFRSAVIILTPQNAFHPNHDFFLIHNSGGDLYFWVSITAECVADGFSLVVIWALRIPYMARLSANNSPPEVFQTHRALLVIHMLTLHCCKDFFLIPFHTLISYAFPPHALYHCVYTFPRL